MLRLLDKDPFSVLPTYKHKIVFKLFPSEQIWMQSGTRSTIQ